MSALKWCLLALTALLSYQSCSANRAFSEFDEPMPPFPEDHVGLSPWPAPDPSPGPGPASGPYPPQPHPEPAPAPGPGPASEPSPPLPTDGSEPVPARTAKPPPKKESSHAPTKNGDNDSDVSLNCGGGWCGRPGARCVPPPPKNTYYCQPARFAAYPGGGGGFTMYLDEKCVAGASFPGKEHKS